MRYYLAVVVDGEPEVVVVFPVSFVLPFSWGFDGRSKSFVAVVKYMVKRKSLLLIVEELTSDFMRSEIVARQSHR